MILRKKTKMTLNMKETRRLALGVKKRKRNTGNSSSKETNRPGQSPLKKTTLPIHSPKRGNHGAKCKDTTGEGYTPPLREEKTGSKKSTSKVVIEGGVFNKYNQQTRRSHPVKRGTSFWHKSSERVLG